MEIHQAEVNKRVLKIYDFMSRQNAVLKEAGVEVGADARDKLKEDGMKALIYRSIVIMVAQARKDPDKRLVKLANDARTLPKGTEERIKALVELTRSVAQQLSAMAVDGIAMMIEKAKTVPGIPEEKIAELKDTMERAEKSFTRIETMIRLIDNREIARHVGLEVLTVFDYILELLDNTEKEMAKAKGSEAI